MRALVLVVLLFGCTQLQARKTHRVGEVATAGGLIGVLAAVTGAAIAPAHSDTLTNIGLVFVPVSLFGALLYIATDEEAREEHHGPVVTRREQRRETAWALTKQAADAARVEDCTQVQAIDPRVRDLDTDFHTVVFMRDVGIQRCLRVR